MEKKQSTSKVKLVLGIVMSSLIMVTLGVSTFAYWQKDSVEVSIPTYEFNATEEEFTYYACIPNVVSTTGYDYYDLESIPTDLVDRVTALATVRFEALTKTAYIPSYPKVNIGGTRYNYETDDLPVIHVLNSLSNDEAIINNGFSHIETLIIPETVTYIQPGSFVNSENLKEVTILGTSETSGYLSVSDDEFNDASVYKEWADRVVEPSNNKIVTTNLRFAQFGDSFEYDNKLNKYYTFVVPSSYIGEGELMTNSPSLSANTKYKLIYDGTTLEAIPYTYEISYGTGSGELILNPNVNYEEYILDTTMNVVRLNSYPVVKVLEYVNNSINEATSASFDLNLLNASYSSDNTVFDIKYSPSYVYESIHYHTDAEDLVENQTRTQISAEKAYFLNQVISKDETIQGENFLEITVPDNSYLGLYVKAGHSSYGDGVYYIDPTDPEKSNIFIEMEKVNSKYRYEFRGTNAPVNNVVPDTFVFYAGKYSVISVPPYALDFANEQEIQEQLKTETYNTKRVYLQLYRENENGDNINEEMIRFDKNPTETDVYEWYVVYWYNDNNGKEVQHYFRVYYADYHSTVLIADIPEIAEKFKFVRIDSKEITIDKALKDNWVNMENYCAEDLYFSPEGHNLYQFNEWWKESYANQFSVLKPTGSMPENHEFSLRNKNYLILSNYGANGVTKYIPLDENLGYSSKDVDKDDGNTEFKLEFTKYENYLDRYIQLISLPKGTQIEARVFNVSASTSKYFANTLSYPSSAEKLTANNKDDVAINSSEIFSNVGGKITILKDCTIEVYLKVDYSETEQATPTSYSWHFNVKTTGIREFSREVIVDELNVVTPVVTPTSRKVGEMTYPYLQSTNNIVKLERNYANTDYEEYRYLSDEVLSGEYVVAPYFEADMKFGGNSGNIYYGTLNPTSCSGELDVTTENMVMFTPNGESAYQDRYFAAFDDYGKFLTFLSFNRTQTINEGYQVLSAVIPQALFDFQNVKIYEVDSEGNILDNNAILNSKTHLSTLLLEYNNSHFDDNSQYIEFDHDNDLLFDYYIRQMGATDENDDNYYTNNIGFTSGVKEDPNDPNSDTLYYFNNVKIDLAEGTGSSNRYQITTKTNKKPAQQIFNNLDPLDEQIIDGYYYNGLCTDGQGSDHRSIRFLSDPKAGDLEKGNAKFKDGYYDFVLRKRGTKLYFGYKYLGDKPIAYTNYYLYVYQNKELIDVIKMDSMSNGNHYFVDYTYEGTIQVEVYNEQKVRLYHDDEVSYTSTRETISRFYFGVTTPISGSDNLVEVQMGKIGLNFNMGQHPTDDSDIRYTETIYNSQLDHYQVKVQAVEATEIYYAKDSNGVAIVPLKKHQNYYSAYITNAEFNKVVKIYLNDTDTTKQIVLPQPGKYEVSFNPTTGIVSCYKVQEADKYYLSIDGERVAELEVNPNTINYYEYIIENHIVLENDLVLVTDNEHPTVNVVEILDVYGNVVENIEKVTYDNLTSTSVVTIVKKGAYNLTYSIDSSRREEDQYHVFTYIKFTPIDSSTIIYNYQVTGAANEDYTKISKTVVRDVNWKFDILDLETIGTFYTPVGTYFAGWSTSPTGEVEYFIDQQYGTNAEELVLYPVFKDRSEKHKVIWIKEPDFDSSGLAIFTLSNLDTTIITDVTYAGYDEYVDKYVSIDTTEGNRIVTVDQSLFEEIGYVNGGVKLVCHLQSEIDGKTSTCTVKVNYPNYDNRVPVSSTYTTHFTKYNSETREGEYNSVGSISSNVTTLYSSYQSNSISWTTYTGAMKENDSSDLYV